MNVLTEVLNGIEDKTNKEYIFIQTLRDDLYIAEKSLWSANGYLFLNARMSSQGDQRAYNVSNIDALKSSNLIWDTVYSNPYIKDYEKNNSSFSCPSVIPYRMSHAEASPYADDKQIHLMRQCSLSNSQDASQE